MPERHDRVMVSYSRGTVELPWASRDALLDEIRGLDSAYWILSKFAAVGASRPIEFSDREKELLVKTISAWSRKVGGRKTLPAGVWELRKALNDDLHDTADAP